MADPITSIGLAASIITLIDCGTSIVKRLNDFIASREEVPEAFRNLVVHLPLLALTLQRIHVQACSGNVPVDVAKALSPVVNETLGHTREIEQELSRLLLPVTADRLTKGIAALRNLSSDQKIKRALDKIRGSIDLLVLHEVVSVHNISRDVFDSIKTLVASATVPQGVNRNIIALLHQACRLGLRQSMRVIINMGVPVDSRDDFDRTPLHTAVINKQTDIVRLLCDNFFAPIDAPDQSGRTPLHLAILNDYIDIAWLLRQRRARLDIFDDYGETPLDMIRGDFLTK